MESASPLSRYQVDHLLLLVGHNPLPNYVAARLLLDRHGVLYLLHTEGPHGTGNVAQRLAAHFAQHRPQLIPIDARSPKFLRRAVDRALPRAAGRIGLHYSGGTKVMAIHTYLAVYEICQDRGIDPVFSYLDADTLELIVEPRLGEPPFSRIVVQDVDVDFRTLFDLHGFRLGPLQTEVCLPNLAQVLAELHATPEGIEVWRQSRAILEACKGRLWSEVKKDLRQAGASEAVLVGLEQGCGFADAPPISLQQAATKAGFRTGQEMMLWLHGEWLEHWVLACVQKLGYRLSARNLEGFAYGRFEIDVAMLRGYQLFALSCSVKTGRGEAKMKLLEIYARARQIGGDEGRMGLVCPTTDPTGLEQEITGEWDVPGRVRVFGAKHLPELQMYLKEWFEQLQTSNRAMRGSYG